MNKSSDQLEKIHIFPSTYFTVQHTHSHTHTQQKKKKNAINTYLNKYEDYERTKGAKEIVVVNNT